MQNYLWNRLAELPIILGIVEWPESVHDEEGEPEQGLGANGHGIDKNV